MTDITAGTIFTIGPHFRLRHPDDPGIFTDTGTYLKVSDIRDARITRVVRTDGENFLISGLAEAQVLSHDPGGV